MQIMICKVKVNMINKIIMLSPPPPVFLND